MICRFHKSIRNTYSSSIFIFNLLICLLFIGNLLLSLDLPPAGTVSAATGSAQESAPARRLETGKPLVRDLAGAQSHFYQVTLSAGQYARVLVDQRGIDVEIKLIGPDGRQIREFDAESNPQGQEIVSWVSGVAGIYRLEVNAKTRAAAPGQYVIQAVVLRDAKDDERALDEASDLINQSHKLFLAAKYDEAIPMLDLAREIRQRVLGAEHPDTGNTLNELARLYAAKGDIAQALTFRAGANYVDESNLDLVAGSNRQKLKDLELFKKRTDITLSLQSQVAKGDQQALELEFTTLLRRKARGIDAMIDPLAAFRRNSQDRDKELFDSLARARSQLAELRYKGPDAYEPESFRDRIKPVADQMNKIEAELSAHSALFRATTRPVTIDAVRAELPSNGALVEFAYLTPVDQLTEKSNPPRYLAYVLTARGQVNWVDLGEAGLIDRAVNLWRDALRDKNRQDVNQLARSLDEKMMQPVRSLLGGATRLLIAPDGALNLIPFAALVDEQNRYLIERYSISYLTTGRDLLRLQSPQPSRSNTLVIANPDFGGDEGKQEKDPTQIYFSPQPDTSREAAAIKELFPATTVLQREEASEKALKEAHGPRILHLATYGFFFDNQDAAAAEGGPLLTASLDKTEANQSPVNPFTVQFEAAPAIELAEEKVKTLSAQGVDAYIVKSSVKGKGDFYRVRAGNFPSIAAAQKYGDELQKRGVVSEYFVARYEPPLNSPPPVPEPLPRQETSLELSKFAAQANNPLLRSGLALAGANRGKSIDDEGFLTALEAAQLDLAGTKLVVLSFNDASVCELKNGEGVQTLRRALILAGAESQVMRLWPVTDEAGRESLIQYYKALQHGEGRCEGLRQVQLRMLRGGRKELHHPFYWAPLIESGEWASLDGNR
ncbi:MAG: CHAT domain-containing protein [Blastocatellia bacterium]|nr:CHAT domain-containing protein [Blastocatellia bacterium]